jgi:chemotaxis protein MotB
MGTSVIKQHFTPGKPDPTPIQELRQQTQEVQKDHLETKDAADKSAAELNEEELAQAKEKLQAQLEAEVAQQAKALKELLDEQIDEGMLEVEQEKAKIIIRIRERGSFPSGRATLNPGFYEVISKITNVISDTPGKIIVAGHTDNIPISTQRFRSNWELSSARAVTVVHAMLSNAAMDEDRFLIEGHADSHPLASNDTSENRAKNRRVEMIITRGEDIESGEVISVSE